MPATQKNLAVNYNGDTNVVAISGVNSEVKAGDVLHSLFASKSLSLQEMAKLTGKRTSQIFKAMFDRNRHESDLLDDRLVRSSDTSYDLYFAGAPEEQATVLPDSVPPTIVSCGIVDNVITITFDDINILNAAQTPAASRFAVLIGENNVVVTRVQIPRNSKTLILTLATASVYGDTIGLTYTQPETASGALQDKAGNLISTFTNPVTNNNTEPAGGE